MNVESIIFDIDGTLWDSRALVAEGYNMQLGEEGLDKYFVTAEELKSLFGKTMTEIADILFVDFGVPERYELMERCMAREDEHLSEVASAAIAYDGVVETLEKLAEKHRLFIVSNSQKGYPELVIEKLGLENLIEAHMCYGDTGTDKGKTIRILMEKCGIKSAVYVGDTQGDYEASVNAGIPFVWATFGFGEPTGYDEKADTFTDLLDVFTLR
ncbi:MAG: HAD family hydrolase [Clostridiales bacterium]|nr:HAD family hydrolase [Clostridiales bacterium]